MLRMLGRRAKPSQLHLQEHWQHLLRTNWNGRQQSRFKGWATLLGTKGLKAYRRTKNAASEVGVVRRGILQPETVCPQKKEVRGVLASSLAAERRGVRWSIGTSQRFVWWAVRTAHDVVGVVYRNLQSSSGRMGPAAQFHDQGRFWRRCQQRTNLHGPETEILETGFA